MSKETKIITQEVIDGLMDSAYNKAVDHAIEVVVHPIDKGSGYCTPIVDTILKDIVKKLNQLKK
jgi:hypothetical protein